MFGKLLKHEIVDTWKIFALLDAVALVLGAIVGVVAFGVLHIEDMPTPLVILLVLGVVGYILLLSALSVLTLVYIVVHFYRSMFSAQGYLTFTLPATATQIFSAKLLSAFIFELINTVCIFLSVVFALWGIVAFGLKENLAEFFEYFNEFKETFTELFGLGPLTIVLYVIFALVSVLTSILIFYCAMCIGQLWQKHKVLGSVVAYFAITIVTRIITTIVQLGTGAFGTSLFDYDLDTATYFNHTMTVNTGIFVIFAVIMYVVCIYTTNRKLNLD